MTTTITETAIQLYYWNIQIVGNNNNNNNNNNNKHCADYETNPP